MVSWFPHRRSSSSTLEGPVRTLGSLVFPLCPVRVGADITLLREREVDYDLDRNARKIAEVLVRKVPDDQQVRAGLPSSDQPR